MTFEAINFRTGERTTFHLIGSHTSTVRLGEWPMRKLGCAGCAAQVGTHPKGGDALAAPALLSDAVPPTGGMRP